MSEKKTGQERWDEFVKEVTEIAQKHDLGGLALIGLLPEAMEDGKTALPTYGVSFFPRFDSASLLYEIRDQFLRILKGSADASIEAALKAVEESKKAESAEPAPSAE